jgi:nitrous oxidase accessory protein NosD
MLSYRSWVGRALIGMATFLALWGVWGQEVGAWQLPKGSNSARATVRTSDELIRALRARPAPDTILLASGAYGQVRIEGVQMERQVVIASADRERPAVIEFLNIRNSKGLTFRNVEIGMEAGGGQGVRVTNSSNIRLEKLDIHGILDGDPTSDGVGMLVERSSDVTIADCKLHDLTSGIGHANSTGLTIRGNDFRLMRVDGIAGNDSNNVLIAGNHFTDFFPLPADHADAIQFWQTAPSVTANITVIDNIFVRGRGAKIQGIFMTASTLGYQDMVVSGNAIVGGMYHGITVAKVTKLEMRDNFVAGYQDQISWLLVQKSNDVVVANNQATTLNVTGLNSNNVQVVQTGNVILRPPKVGDTTGLERWKVKRAAARPG